MKINWKVRVLSVKFWLALVPAALLVVQTVA
ncbi:phage holin, partial [Lacticaseibacillus rhamnosus]